MRTKPMRNRLHLWLWVGAFALLWPAMANADYLSDGKKAFAKGDLRTAAVQLRNAVRTDPQNGEAHFMLARTQFELGDLSAAEKEVQAAIDRGFDKQQALPLLISAYLAGGKYDKALLSMLIKLLGVYPPGTVVQLSDGTLALVVSPGATSLQPKVLIYSPEVPRDEAPTLDLADEPGLKVAEAIRPSTLPTEVLAWLNPQQRLSYFYSVSGASAAA